MTIYSIYILSKSGGLIFNTDQNMPKIELEKTFSYPIPYKLVYENNRVVVKNLPQISVYPGLIPHTSPAPISAPGPAINFKFLHTFCTSAP